MLPNVRLSNYAMLILEIILPFKVYRWQPKLALLATLIKITTSALIAAPASARDTFDDVSGHWAQNCIEALAQRQIVVGYPDGKFRPDSPGTRAELAVMLRKAFPNQKRVHRPIQFNDIPRNHWAYDAIRTVYQMGFLSEYADLTFKPNQKIARFEVLIALVSGLNHFDTETGTIFETLTNSYQDALAIPESARAPIAAATTEGIVVNYPNVRLFNPNQHSSRADVAAFLCQTLVGSLPSQLVPSQYVAGQALVPQIKAEKFFDRGEIAAAKQGNNKLAIDYFNASIQLNPRYTEAYYRRGLAHSRVGDEQEAIKDYIQVLLIDPDSVRESWYAYPTRPTKDYIQALQTPPRYAEDYYERGVVRYYLTDYEGAFRDLSRAIQLNPKFAEAYYIRGCSRSPSKPKWDAAIADFSTAIQLNPNFAAAYYSRGIVQRHLLRDEQQEIRDEQQRLRDEQRAIADFTQAIKRNPEGAEDYYTSEIFRNFKMLRYEDYYYIGENSGYILKMPISVYVQKAIDAYTKAIQLNPEYNFDDFKNNRLRSCLDPRDRQRTIENHTQTIQLNPKNAHAYFVRGLARNDLGDKQGAIDDYSQVIRLDPKSTDAYFYRGVAKYRLKDYKGAIADYTEAIKLSPKDIDIYFVRGLAHYDSGDMQGAVEDTSRAIPPELGFIPPEYNNAHLIRAHARNALGDRQGAEQDYRQVVPKVDQYEDLSLCEMFYEECSGGGSVTHVTQGRDKNARNGRRRGRW